MTELEALEAYDTFLWKQVHSFTRSARYPNARHEDLIQEARIAFLQHIRTHSESEWAACTLTIKGALYDYVRREYPQKVSRHGFGKALRGGRRFCPFDECTRYIYEDDHSAIDLTAALDQLSEENRELIALKLKGLTVGEIAVQMGKSHQVISHRLKAIRCKTLS